MSKFRNANNTRLTASLFLETNVGDRDSVVYTLRDEPRDGYPSLYQAYISCNDPTEYTFAKEYLDGWEHWEQLCEATWFKPYLTRWRRELELKIKSEALANIITESRSGSSNSYQASKFLVNGEWNPAPKSRRGRPSKDEVKSEAKRIAEDHFRLKEDFERLGAQGLGVHGNA